MTVSSTLFRWGTLLGALLIGQPVVAQIPQQGVPQAAQGNPNAARPNVPTRQPFTRPAPSPPAVATPSTASAAAAKPAEPIGDGIVIQYPNTPLPQILLDYEEWTGMKVIRDANVEQATVTIETTGELPKEQAIRYLEASLLLNGYSFVPAGPGMVKILAADAKKPSTEGSPLFTDAMDLPDTEQVVTFIATLEHITAEDAVTAIDQIIPRHSYGLVQAVKNMNSLVIVENTITIRAIMKLLDKLDVAAQPEIQKAFQLERADAEQVASALGEILAADEEGGSSGVGGVTGVPGAAPGGAPAAGIGVSTAGGGAGAKPPKIISIPRLNRILVMATEDVMAKISLLIEQLDAPAELRNYESRQLSYVTVEAAMQVISDAISRGTDPNVGGAGGVIGPGGTTPAATNTNTTNSNRFGGNTFGGGGFGGNSFGGGGFGGGFGGGGVGGGFGGGGFGGGVGGGGGQPLRQNSEPSSLLIGKTLLIGDPANNTLFCSGPPEHLEILNQIIDEIDKRPKQIAISVVIGELNMSENFQFGISYLLRPTRFKINELAGTGSGILRNPTQALTDVNGLEDVADFADFAGGLTAIGSLDAGVDAILQALSGNRNFEVISRPTLLTLNNQPADITSGTSIPVPTASTNSITPGADGNFGVTSQISFQPIVLGLSVTPLINNDNELTLRIQQQNNEQSGTTTINGNPFPNISQQTLNTTVMVQNGSTVLLGGLIRENVEKEREGLPFLKDIPLVKHLVSSMRDAKTRRELLVFIQPRIVDGNGDLPPNYADSAGQSPFGDKMRRFMTEEHQPPAEGVKPSRLGELFSRLLRREPPVEEAALPFSE